MEYSLIDHEKVVQHKIQRLAKEFERTMTDANTLFFNQCYKAYGVKVFQAGRIAFELESLQTVLPSQPIGDINAKRRDY